MGATSSEHQLASKISSFSIDKPPSTTPTPSKPPSSYSSASKISSFSIDPRPESLFKAGAAIDIDTLQVASAKAVATASDALAAAYKALDAASEVATTVAAYAASAPAPSHVDVAVPVPVPVPVPVNYELQYKLLSKKACKALEYYKNTKEEEFELVEMGKFENTFLYPYWITHITFLAKPKNSDSCPSLFFAEVYEKPMDAADEYEVKICVIMDPFSQDVMKGCGYVEHDEDMLHPKGVEFWAGPPSGISI